MPYSNKEEQREYQRKWIAKRRLEFLADKKCCKCDSTEKLEIHHKDPSKKITHRIWSYSKAKRDAELNKCIVVCHDCHLNETRKWYQENLKHGSKTMYWIKKCRCPECLQYGSSQSEERKDRYLLTGQ